MWGEGGACLVGFVRDVWVFCDIWQGYPCFWPWLPLGIVYFGFIGAILGSVEEWGEVEPCSIWPDDRLGVGLDFCQGLTWFRHRIPLGNLNFWVLGV